jgi:hypothetical protein
MTAKFIWMIFGELAHSGDAADSYDAGLSCVSNLSRPAFGWPNALDALVGAVQAE